MGWLRDSLPVRRRIEVQKSTSQSETETLRTPLSRDLIRIINSLSALRASSATVTKTHPVVSDGLRDDSAPRSAAPEPLPEKRGSGCRFISFKALGFATLGSSGFWPRVSRLGLKCNTIIVPWGVDPVLPLNPLAPLRLAFRRDLPDAQPGTSAVCVYLVRPTASTEK